jgi:hypothetical protein
MFFVVIASCPGWKLPVPGVYVFEQCKIIYRGGEKYWIIYVFDDL